MLSPLALEVEAMIKSGLAHVWDEMRDDTKMLIRAWYREQSTMAAWEQVQSEKTSGTK